MQFNKILAYALTVCLLLSLTVPAYAADDLIYSVDTDADLVYIPQVYYTEGYTPGMYADVDRSSSLFSSTRVTYGSYSYYGYVPYGSYTTESGAVRNFVMSDYEPLVNVTSSVISAAQTVPNTTLIYGDLLNVVIPSTSDSYFDFSGSTLLYDQSDALANTFILNGTLRFKLSNLWSFTSNSSEHPDVSFYRASDPLAIQLLVNGKPYGDIIDVTSYTSPFTAATSGNPAFASVTFDNLKVYYNGDTPELIGFRVYTGSSYGSYTYNYGSYLSTTLQNLLSLQWTEQPDISFVQEGGDGYAGDLSGISGLLSDISGKLSQIFTAHTTGNSWLDSIYQRLSSVLQSALSFQVSSWQYLTLDGTLTTSPDRVYLVDLVRRGFVGLRSLMVDSSGQSWLAKLYNSQMDLANNVSWMKRCWDTLNLQYFYISDRVFPWQSYNMETHELNAATNITGQNNLFFTAFQSIEDKLGRLAYVFGSDEDLALKDAADPGTDAFRENFGGGLSFGQISDGADVVEGVNGLFDSGYSFGDAFTEIAGEAGFFAWFTPENAAALDSTGSLMTLDDSDPYNMQIYYDHVQKVKEKREAGDD